jgi:hypothetical protein
MPLRESELESEFEDEGEFENEYEYESEDEGEAFNLGGVINGLLGESEFESEYESEDEGEAFNLGGVIGGLLGEGEFEDEGEEFLGGIAKFVKRHANVLKSVARLAAPLVGTALGGPLGGTLGSMAVRALGEGEFEMESEFEDEGEFEDELEGEFEDEAAHPMTESEAMAEMMAAVAARAQTDAEAEAMIGAATITVLSARDRAELRRLLPYIVRASCVLARILRRDRRSRPALRTVPYIVKNTARNLCRQSASGRPVSRRAAARVMSRQTRGVLGNPRRTAVALRRNVRATRALRTAGGRAGTPYPRTHHVRRRRAYP